jgi:hypothetical protein
MRRVMTAAKPHVTALCGLLWSLGEQTVNLPAQPSEVQILPGPQQQTGRSAGPRGSLEALAYCLLQFAVAMPRAPTVGEWVKTWIEIVERSRKPSTARTYRTHVKYLELIRRVRPDNLTPEHIEAVYVGLVNRGVSPVSVRGVHRTLRSCFGEASRGARSIGIR